MDERDHSKSPIREEILMISEDDKFRISMDPEESESSKEGEEKDEKKARIVSIRELFRYATLLDILMMLVGILSGVIHGVCFLFLFVVFGITIDEFVVFSAGGPFRIFCDVNLNITVNCTDRSEARDDLIDYVNHPIIFYYCLIGVISLVSGWLQVTLFQLAAERQVTKIRTLFFRAILKQEISWFDLNPTGEINSRLNDDLEKVSKGIGDKLAFIFQALGTFVGGLVLGFVYVWQLALLMIGCAPIVIVLGGIVQRLVTKLTAQEQAQYAGAGAIAEEVIGSIRTVMAFGGQEKEVERYASHLRDAKKVGIRKGLISGVGFGINFLVLFGILGLAYWFSAYLITNVSGVSAGNVLITFFVLVMGSQFIGQAAPNVQDLAIARGSAGALYDIIDREPEMENGQSEKGLKPEKFDSDVRLTDVSFSYPSRPSVQVLDELSISVSPGQTLALVGASGCGKSTVVQLIQRFYDVASGQVKVGGYDVRDLNLYWLRQRIGVVSQEPVLFATTIAENIRYGHDEVTQEEIEAAAKAANAHSFISELPDGYNTLVGERGTQLSGGQKQRVAIARALVRDPKILLLDEATSALDSESEAVVQAALDKARQGRTTIVIAHRLSTIQGADIIAAVADGTVVETGTHSQLLRMKGVYYDLVTAQSYGEVGDPSDEIVSEMMKKYKRQTSGQDEAVKVEHQISRQYSRQQSNPDATTPAPADFKDDKKAKEAEEKEEAEQLAEYSLLMVLWRVLYLNSPEIHFVILGFLFSAINGMVFPTYSIFFGEILEDYSDPESAEENARLWAGFLVALGGVTGTAMLLRSWFFSIAGESLTMRFRKRSFRNMLRQDMNWFDQTANSTGKLTTRLSHDAAAVQGAVGIQLGLLVEVVVTIFAGLIIAIIYSWSLTLLILGFMPLLAITQAFQGRVMVGVAASAKKGYEESSNIAYEAIANIRTVASLGLEERMGNLFEDKIRHPHKKSMHNAFLFGVMSGFSGGLIYFTYAVLFRFGAFIVTSDPDNVAHTSFRNFITVLTVLVMAGVQAGRITTFLPNYSKAVLSAKRIFKVLDTVPAIDNYSTEGLEPEMVDGSLSLEKLHFIYPSRPNVPVLQGLNITVQSGQTLALVGPSGCGKSTVVSLLERFYDPDDGVVRFDGQNLKSLNIQWLRRQMGLVSQEPVLFDTSIADNIRYGANFREVSDEEVEMAAKSANIHDFVMSLPQGYSTNVGSKGTQLSGGQKQRVAIARALVRDPKIMLLDEATSALDTESEQIVQEALDNARKGRTTVVIAHRLSTIHNADCIAVIKDGVVIEAGTHSQLMEWKGAYYKLNNAQMLVKH